MITIKGYAPVDYQTFQGLLFDTFKRSKRTYFQVATDAKLKSSQTAVNAISRKADQMVSDKALTVVMDVVGLKGCVVTQSGQKYYYVKEKK